MAVKKHVLTVQDKKNDGQDGHLFTVLGAGEYGFRRFSKEKKTQTGECGFRRFSKKKKHFQQKKKRTALNHHKQKKHNMSCVQFFRRNRPCGRILSNKCYLKSKNIELMLCTCNINHLYFENEAAMIV